MLATCYGASNTGQLAGGVATELAREEGCGLVCLPAVAIDKVTGLDKVAEAELLVVIEGCAVMRRTQIVEEHGERHPDVRVEMVQNYGVEKTAALSCDQEKKRIKRDMVQPVEKKLRERKNE